jgi:hypothetical protein
MQLCECADSFQKGAWSNWRSLRFVAVICPAHQPAKVLECLGIANGPALLLASGIGAFGLGGFSDSVLSRRVRHGGPACPTVF